MVPARSNARVASADDDAPVKTTTAARAASAPTQPPVKASAPVRTTSPSVPDDGRPTAVYVASLTWWTTDAELEAVLAEFGRVKSLTFFADRATGKSKGCCAVEFATADAAAQCKDNLHGREINGKKCVVTLAEIPKTPAAALIGPNDPLPPPPDTAWKGPIPPDKPGYGGVPYNAPSIHQQQMMRQQQQQFMMAQQMQNATPAMRAQMLQQMQQGGGVPPSGKAPPPPPPPPGVIPPKRQRKE